MRPTTPAALMLLASVAVGAALPLQAQAQDVVEPLQAQAQGPDRDGFQFQLGVAALYRPEYKGSKDYEVSPLPFVSFRYARGDRYVALEGGSIKANIISGGGFEFGPILNFERGRDDDIKNLPVRALGEIDDTLMAGGFLTKEIDLGRGTGLQFGAAVLADTGDANEGVNAKFEAGYHRQLADRWTVMVGASTTWADENYLQAYYGVTPAGALASGLAAYTADSGFENVEVSAGLRYRVNDRWSILGQASYQRLLDSAADSPVVLNGGSENQGQFVLAVIRAF